MSARTSAPRSSLTQRRRFLLLAGLGLLGARVAASGPVERPAEMMPLAIRSLLLDIGRIGERLVAVGERGHILISDDGRSFTQVAAPVRSTLTAVAGAADGGPAFAVGHDGVILRSTDRGTSWQLVFSAPEQQRPLLDVIRQDAGNVLAVGAYGWLVRSEDGGARWTEASIDEDEPHLNGLAAGEGDALLIAAEFGLVYHSADGGRTLGREALPYGGSVFAALRAYRSWLVFGLRGHVFRQDDDGTPWQPVRTPAEATLLTGLRLSDGRIVLAGLEGALLVSEDAQHFDLVRDSAHHAIAALADLGDGALLLAGEGGLRRMRDLGDPSSIEPVRRAAR